MDTLVVALGPAFAVGFGIQRLAEISDPIFDRLAGGTTDDAKKTSKRMLIAVVSLLVGLATAYWAGIRVLAPLGAKTTDLIDIAVTALVVSGGTEGFNSIMKFLTYKKEEQKEETKIIEQAGPTAVAGVQAATARAMAAAAQ